MVVFIASDLAEATTGTIVNLTVGMVNHYDGAWLRARPSQAARQILPGLEPGEDWCKMGEVLFQLC